MNYEPCPACGKPAKVGGPRVIDTGHGRKVKLTKTWDCKNKKCASHAFYEVFK